jgi:hypothetical protein
MKIAITSDLHLEFSPIKLKNDENADVLVLAGDIIVAEDLNQHEPYLCESMKFGKSDRYHEFFGNCVREFPKVVYVAGNHEHYHGDFASTISKLRKNLGYLRNLHILEKEKLIIDDVTFLCGTLWTDMNRADPITLQAIKGMMNDFRVIRNSNRMIEYKTNEGVRNQRVSTFSPLDALEDHEQMMNFLREELKTIDSKVVIVGHHTPSHKSIHEMYASDTIMNGGYHSDLSEFILNHTQIALWIHGHTHNRFDYMIGETRVVCNPRGYETYEETADNFNIKYVEV